MQRRRSLHRGIRYGLFAHRRLVGAELLVWRFVASRHRGCRFGCAAKWCVEDCWVECAFIGGVLCLELEEGFKDAGALGHFGGPPSRGLVDIGSFLTRARTFR
jgi:hypothetical protein